MKHRSIPTLARASALFVLLLVVMALGLQPTVWATSNPVQAGQTVPTRTPGPRLNLAEIRCDGQDVLVEFLVVHLPHGISDYGAVSYTVNGLTRTAKFDKQTGGVAHYVDLIPPAAQASDGVYEVTTATLVIVANGKEVNLRDNFPGARRASCTHPNPPNPDNKACPNGRNHENVGPGAARVISDCPWWINVDADDFSDGGAIEIARVAPGAAPPPNGGDIFVGGLIEVTLFDKDGKPVLRPTFSRPIELCYQYSAEDAARAGGATNFSFQTFDTATSQWVVVSTSLDSINGVICAQLSHLSMFGLSAKSGARAAPEAVAAPIAPVAGAAPANRPSVLPNTGLGAGEAIPVWMWIMIGIAFGIAGALGAWRLLRR